MKRGLMKLVFALALASAAPLAACVETAPPLRTTAAQIGPIPDNYGEAVIPQGGTIVLQGDDAIYGHFRHGHRAAINGADEKRGAATVAESLSRYIRHVTVVDHGFPGDTVSKSAARWSAQPVGDLLILSFGYGDYAAKTDIKAFTANLANLVKQAQAKGAAVFIVTTPPATRLELYGLNAYRKAAQQVAAQQGVAVFDTSVILTADKVAPSRDEHGRADIYQAIAGAMVPYIQVVPELKAKT